MKMRLEMGILTSSVPYELKDHERPKPHYRHGMNGEGVRLGHAKNAPMTLNNTIVVTFLIGQVKKTLVIVTMEPNR
jgi:hypothetical protein